MSFLAPLYAAGILAVSLPIIFHLIRRTPRARVAFSSLMFLSPSPPRVTRRSRLENLFLLFLRALAICLLAAAFARPFLRDASRGTVNTAQGDRIVVLVDTSASMRRAGLWDRAVERALAEIDDATPQDQVAVVAFNAHVRPLLTFAEWDDITAGSRREMVRDLLQDVRPGWQASHLDTALSTAADMLMRDQTDEDPTAATGKRIVLISDLQQGSRLTGLQSVQWPDEVSVVAETLAPESTNNAGLQIVALPPDRRHSEDALVVRVRVTNAADSRTDRFELAWTEGEQKPPADKRQDIYVPAGQSRIVKAPPQPAGATSAALRLFGDDQPFDNVVYHVPPQQQVLTIWYAGEDTGDDPAQARYYLQRALAESPLRRVEIVGGDAGEFNNGQDVALAVVTTVPSPESLEKLKDHLAAGGTVLFTLPNESAVAAVAELVGSGTIPAEESSPDGYTMLENIRFDHPWFASFSEARFSDFTKIHFWKHRRIDETALPQAEVLARFDDGAPALLEMPVGTGALVLLTSGWTPTDSQLALSSKFAPLLHAIVEQAARIPAAMPAYYVGETVTCTLDGAGEGEVVLSAPHAAPAQLKFNDRTTDATSAPGIYEFQRGDERQVFAVNLHPEESQTAPLPTDQLEQLGLVLNRPPTEAQLARADQQQRQLKNRELENRQKLWQWLIAAALVVLILETWWAGRSAKTVQPPAA